ncbi:hypothetical protein EV696_1162 [Permianibacter aggregans]|uniref:PA14 domain-containing protein n=1 Tax=Permianibacter aggregans TaxID=1510150 RepID=A0A4R6UK91_9GAMM|nr:hypothetical protein EV696_1162 [Permianibacter aggregans]
MRNNSVMNIDMPLKRLCVATACAFSMLMFTACSAPSETGESTTDLSVQKPATPALASLLQNKRLWSSASASCRVAVDDRKLLVGLDWDKPQQKMSGYQVWRAQGTSNEWVRLTVEAQAKTNYIDSSVVNGEGYRYRVIGLPKTESDGEQTICDGVEAFVAVSTAKMDTCTVEEVNNESVRVSWESSEPTEAVVAHRIHTKVPKPSFEEIHTSIKTKQGNLLHNEAAYGFKNIYQVTPVQRFINPFTQEHKVLDGAPCQASIKLKSDISLAVDNAHYDSDNEQWLVFSDPNETISVTFLPLSQESDISLNFKLVSPKRLKLSEEKIIPGNQLSSVSLPMVNEPMVWSVRAKGTSDKGAKQQAFIKIIPIDGSGLVDVEPSTSNKATRNKQQVDNRFSSKALQLANSTPITRGWHLDFYQPGTSLSGLENAVIERRGVSELNVPPNTNFVIRAVAYLDVPADGDYCFFLDSNVNAQLYFGNTRIFDIQQTGGPAQSKMGCGHFLKGYRMIQVRQDATTAERHLRLFWKGPYRYWESLRGKTVYREQLDSQDANDQDGDGFSDVIDAFPENIHEWFDQDGDGTGDNADLDTDGDGRNNQQDLFPFDQVPESDESANPLSLNFSEQNKSLTLTWVKRSEGSYGYRIYRTAIDGSGRALIADLLPSRTSFVIENVANNSAYRYSLGYINDNGLDRPYIKDPHNAWFAWNDQPISSCTVQQVNANAEVGFVPVNALANIERQIGGSEFVALANKATAPFHDPGIRHGGEYRYRLHSVVTYLDPFRFVEVDFPSTQACLTDTLTANSSFNIAISGMELVGPGQYQRDPALLGNNIITGQIQDAMGPVSLLASSGQVSLPITVNGQTFSAELPITDEHTNWTLRAEETEAISENLVNLSAVFVLDKTPPVIAIESSIPALTYTTEITLVGKITDAKTGIASAVVKREGLADSSLSLDAEGQFSVALSLVPGVNTFEVIAIDGAGNSTTTMLATEQDRNLPVLHIVEPEQNSSTYEEQTVVRGNVAWRHELAGLSLTINQQAVQLQQNGVNIEFSQSGIALTEGDNTILFELASPVGSMQQSLTIKRLVDSNPPSIIVNAPAEPVTTASQAAIMGRVTDDRSGIAQVYWEHSRIPGQNGLLLNDQGEFQFDAPLDEGDNIITVHAVDNRNNAASRSTTITREDQMATMLITEPAEGMLTDQTSVQAKITVTYRKPLADLSLRVNGAEVSLTATAEAHQYQGQTSVALVDGLNTILFQLQTPRGVLEQTRRVTLDPDKANENDVPPALSVRRPLDQSVLSGETHELELNLRASARPIQITINGVSAEQISWLDASTARVQHSFSFAQEQTQVTFNVQLVDQKNRQANLTATYYRDAAAPEIEVDRFAGEPALNEVVENPVRITGVVRDERLAALTFNGQAVGLQPGTNLGEHQFSVNLSLAPNLEQLVTLSARDTAGNQTQKVLRFKSVSTGGIQVLLPVANAEFIAENSEFPLNVTVQIEGDSSQTFAFAKVNQGEWQALERQGVFAQGTVLHASTEGEQQLFVELRAGDGQVLAADSRRYHLKSLANIPLEVVRVQPENGARDVEPNEFIAVHFNKPIDPNKFSLIVEETAHGMTYQNLDPLGTDFTQAKGSQLVEVSRSRAAVPGELSVVPGSRSMAFYPKQDVAYEGEIYVEAKYDGEVVARFAYNTRPLPTLLGGIVVDPLGQAIPGITVSLPALNRTATTDTDGAFSFGFGDTAAEALPAGRQLLVVNPQQQSPAFASQDQWITVQKGRSNDVGIITVPPLNPNVGYRLAQGGEAVLSLAEGDLRLNLSDAQLLFPDGKRQGNIHAQFLSFHEFGKSFSPYAIPHWIFNLQPQGIRVEGEWSLSLTMPKLNGSHDYLLIPDFYVVIVGADEEGRGIVPIGVGRLQNAVVTSVGKLQSNRLDHIGVAMVNFNLQETLQKYGNGEISWVELESALISVGSGQ